VTGSRACPARRSAYFLLPNSPYPGILPRVNMAPRILKSDRRGRMKDEPADSCRQYRDCSVTAFLAKTRSSDTPGCHVVFGFPLSSYHCLSSSSSSSRFIKFPSRLNRLTDGRFGVSCDDVTMFLHPPHRAEGINRQVGRFLLGRSYAS